MDKTTVDTFDEEVNITFAARLKAAMELRGKSQANLAKDSGLSAQTISYYFNGDRLPNTDVVKKLAETLEVSADYLLGIAKYPSADMNIQKMSDRLGLSDKSLYALQGLVDIIHGAYDENISKNEARAYLDIFNTLIEDNNYLDLFADIKRYNYIFCMIEMFEIVKDANNHSRNMDSTSSSDELYDGVQFNGGDIAVTVKPAEAKYAILNKATDDLREIIKKYIKNFPLKFGKFINNNEESE